MDTGRVSQCIFPSDGDQHVNLEVLQHTQHVIGEVERLGFVQFPLGA